MNKRRRSGFKVPFKLDSPSPGGSRAEKTPKMSAAPHLVTDCTDHGSGSDPGDSEADDSPVFLKASTSKITSAQKRTTEKTTKVKSSFSSTEPQSHRLSPFVPGAKTSTSVITPKRPRMSGGQKGFNSPVVQSLTSAGPRASGQGRRTKVDESPLLISSHNHHCSGHEHPGTSLTNHYHEEDNEVVPKPDQNGTPICDSSNSAQKTCESDKSVKSIDKKKDRASSSGFVTSHRIRLAADDTSTVNMGELEIDRLATSTANKIDFDTNSNPTCSQRTSSVNPTWVSPNQSKMDDSDSIGDESSSKSMDKIDNSSRPDETPRSRLAYMEKLHTYNELKDTASMLLGKLAEAHMVTVKEMYARYGVGEDD